MKKIMEFSKYFHLEITFSFSFLEEDSIFDMILLEMSGNISSYPRIAHNRSWYNKQLSSIQFNIKIILSVYVLTYTIPPFGCCG